MALAWGWLPNINKSTVDKMVDKIEHIDTVFVSGNVDYEVVSKVSYAGVAQW